jgi:DNA mismatch repair protein MutS
MKFEADKQTLEDLEIFEKSKGLKSVFGIFNHVQTVGARHRLDEMLRNPLNELDFIKQRSEAIHYFQTSSFELHIDKDVVDFIEFYIKQDNYPVHISRIRALHRAVKYYFKPTNEYYLIRRGINYILELLPYIYSLVKKNYPDELPTLIKNYNLRALNVFNQPEFEKVIKRTGKKKLGLFEVENFDFIFRYAKYEDLRLLLDILYEYDVFKSVAKASEKNGFSYPKYLATKDKSLQIKGLFHPFIDNPVPNDLYFTQGKSIYFITGANMAGKSTLIKAFGISVYLAHVGFPIPAKKMSLTLLNGLVTTINISDNLTKGLSHFYSEVIRIKNVAEKISQFQHLVVVFDELFRGTNVKDAYDASLAIIKALSKIPNCFFVISTHIAEIAEELKPIDNINFSFLSTEIDEGIPKYSYRLQEGVTHERLGMVIINQEKILEILRTMAK